jgi:hypothetical protein
MQQFYASAVYQRVSTRILSSYTLVKSISRLRKRRQMRYRELLFPIPSIMIVIITNVFVIIFAQVSARALCRSPRET